MIDELEAVKWFDKNHNYNVSYKGKWYSPSEWNKYKKENEKKQIFVVLGYKQQKEYYDYIVVVARNASHAMNLKKRDSTWEVATCYKVCDYIGIQFDNGTILEEHWVD